MAAVDGADAGPAVAAVLSYELLPVGGKYSSPDSAAIVDVGFSEVVAVASWWIDTRGYVRGGSCGRHKLHRFVLALAGVDAPSPDCVPDHMNGNKLDNRIANLRWATPGQNAANMRRPYGISRFKGVHPWQGRWRAMIRERGKTRHIGMYDTEEDAAIAYDERARIVFGQFAATNADLGLLPAPAHQADAEVLG